MLYPADNLNGTFGSASDPAQMITVNSLYSISYPESGYDNNGTDGELVWEDNTVPIEYVSRYQGTATVVTQVPHGIIGNLQWINTTDYSIGQQVWFENKLWTALMASGPDHGGAVTPSTISPLVWQFDSYGPNLSDQIVSVSVASVLADPIDEPWLGSYMWDLTAPYTLSGNYATINQPIVATESQPALQVTVQEGTLADQPGFLLFDLNEETQEGPVPYLSVAQVPGSNQATIFISPAYVFTQNHAVGADMTVLSSNQAHVPAQNGSDYQFYITDTASGRTFLTNIITDQLTAMGINLEIVVVYPSDIGLGNAGDSATTPPLTDAVYVWGPATIP